MRPTGRLLLVAALGVAGCGAEGGGTGETLTVLAATSLTEPLGEVAAAFEAEHEELDVALTFDGSARLATAVIEGVPADVFASADVANLAKVAEAGRAQGTSTVFATNRLQIVVAEGNPLGIGGLDDLDGDVVLSLCAVEVPCGSYATQAFRHAGLPTPRGGEEENVRAVLSRVQLGEADAGIVYVTDVLGADGVEGIDLAPDEGVEASYPATVLTDANDPGAAAAFVAFLTGAQAQAILAAHGFGPAP